MTITNTRRDTNHSVPVAIGASLIQASIYDVPGGYRAVLFDRFSGVRADVSCVCHIASPTILYPIESISATLDPSACPRTVTPIEY